MFEVKSIEYFTHKNEPAYQGIFSNVSRTQSLAHKAAFSPDKFTQFWQKICSLQWNEIAYCLRNNDLNLGLFFDGGRCIHWLMILHSWGLNRWWWWRNSEKNYCNKWTIDRNRGRSIKKYWMWSQLDWKLNNTKDQKRLRRCRRYFLAIFVQITWPTLCAHLATWSRIGSLMSIEWESEVGVPAAAAAVEHQKTMLIPLLGSLF